jgi:hypothetical protein
MEQSACMALGVVVERRRSSSPWQDWAWRPVSVLVGCPPLGGEWRELMRGETWTHYHAANLPLELHRTETDAYLLNLAQRPPRVYVVLRPASEPGPYPLRPLLITASPLEAEGYLSTGEEIVEGVPMPAAVVGWLQGFVKRHHVERPFIKRKRSKGGAVASCSTEGTVSAGVAPVGSGRGDDG